MEVGGAGSGVGIEDDPPPLVSLVISFSPFGGRELEDEKARGSCSGGWWVVGAQVETSLKHPVSLSLSLPLFAPASMGRTHQPQLISTTILGGGGGGGVAKA